MTSSQANAGSGGRPAWRTGAVVGAVALGAVLGAPAIASAATHQPGTAHQQVAVYRQATVAGATLALKAGTALPDQKVGFTGGGFRAGEKVTLHWGSAGGTILATVAASKTGTVSGTFDVPLPKAGVTAKVALTAVGASSGKQAKTSFTQSCTDEWTDLSGGNWSTAKDWSTGAVPGASTAACVTLSAAKSYTVTLGKSVTAGSLQVGAQSGKYRETLAVSAGSTSVSLTLDHTSLVHANGELALTSSGSGGDSLTGAGQLQNFGLLTTIAGKGGRRLLGENLVNEASGTIAVAAGPSAAGGTPQSGGTTQAGDSTLLNRGTLDVLKGSELDVSAGATLDQAGGDVSNGGTLQVSGTLQKQGGSADGTAWQLLTGASLQDKAGTGSFTFTGGGTISGLIPKGQAVTVDGDASSGVRLGLDGAVTNDGTLTLTSSAVNGDGAGLVTPAGDKTKATLDNFGTLLTQNGNGGARYFDVNLHNEAAGAVSLAADATQLDAGSTITNDGTLNLAVAANLDLDGGSGGEADLVDEAGSTTGIAIDSDATSGASSVIDQEACSDPACQNESIQLGGTLKVSQAGDGTIGEFVLIFSMNSALSGTFSAAPQGLLPTYNGQGVPIPAAVGSLLLSLP